MAFLRILSLMLVALFSNAMACEYPQDLPWKNAYRGEMSLVNKQYLSFPRKSLHDKICQQFYFAYGRYRSGDMAEALLIFAKVDDLIKKSLYD